jgi:hypothetical protein
MDGGGGSRPKYHQPHLYTHALKYVSYTTSGTKKGNLAGPWDRPCGIFSPVFSKTPQPETGQIYIYFLSIVIERW